MRKILLGTTAIVTVAAFTSPALAADKIKLELRGYGVYGAAAIVDHPGDDDEGSTIVFGSDSEVHFRGKTTLDNGLEIAVKVEMEIEDDQHVDSDGDLIDEAYAHIRSGLGKLEFGMQDGVADQMIMSAPNVFAEVTISSIDLNPFELYTSSDIDSPARDILGESSVLDTSPDYSWDFTKVSYFTPRIFGFQLGVSYTPNPCRHDTGFDLNNQAETRASAGESCGNKDIFGDNYVEIAGNFEHKFHSGNFGVGLSGSYGFGQGNNNFNFDYADGPKEWHLGGNVFLKALGGTLTIGGAYKDTQGIDAINDTAETLFGRAESQHYDAGVMFEHGPWTFGGAYGNVKSKQVTDLDLLLPFTADAELTMIIGGASYKMGPGVTLGLGVIHGDAGYDEFEGGTPGFADDAKATAVFTELDLRF